MVPTKGDISGVLVALLVLDVSVAVAAPIGARLPRQGKTTSRGAVPNREGHKLRPLVSDSSAAALHADRCYVRLLQLSAEWKTLAFWHV